jgi:lysozyme
VNHTADYTALSLADTLLRKHEGTRQFVYQCPAGFNTIAVGRNLDTRGVLPDEIELMLSNDIKACAEDLRGFDWWDGLTPNRKAALIDLRFCVGPAGFRGFKKMLVALEAKDWKGAAEQIMDSKFALQTGHRAADLAGLIRVG